MVAIDVSLRAVVVASWNIQKGIGTDFRRRLSRTADVLASAGADVIGLQEVVRARDADQAGWLARSLGLELVWGPTRELAHRRGTYGNALLVAGKVHDVRIHDLSVPHCEKRSCLEALVETRGVRARIFVCHFGLGPRERQTQIDRLMGALRRRDEPRIVLGDFNEWRRGPVARAFEQEFPHLEPPKRTHPSPWPLFALDRIVWDAELVGDTEVRDVRGASDHRLLRATLDAYSKVHLN